MALVTIEKEDLIRESNRIAAEALSIASFLAMGSVLRAGTTAVALRGQVDAWLEKLSAEASD